MVNAVHSFQQFIKLYNDIVHIPLTFLRNGMAGVYSRAADHLFLQRNRGVFTGVGGINRGNRLKARTVMVLAHALTIQDTLFEGVYVAAAFGN